MHDRSHSEQVESSAYKITCSILINPRRFVNSVASFEGPYYSSVMIDESCGTSLCLWKCTCNI